MLVVELARDTGVSDWQWTHGGLHTCPDHPGCIHNTTKSASRNCTSADVAFAAADNCSFLCMHMLAFISARIGVAACRVNHYSALLCTGMGPSCASNEVLTAYHLQQLQQ